MDTSKILIDEVKTLVSFSYPKAVFVDTNKLEEKITKANFADALNKISRSSHEITEIVAVSVIDDGYKDIYVNVKSKKIVGSYSYSSADLKKNLL